MFYVLLRSIQKETLYVFSRKKQISNPGSAQTEAGRF